MDRKAEIQKAREIDEQVAALWNKYYDVVDQIKAAQKAIRSAKKMISAGYDQRGYHAGQITKLEGVIESLRAEVTAKREVAVEFDKARYEGWNRFFLVQHIHNSQYCSSFRDTTRVAWLPNVSGLTEAEAVAEHGEALCTICFPTAPVALTIKPAEEGVCAGSGQPIDRTKLTGREDSYYSPTGTCKTCGEVVGLTSRRSGKVRKHKAS